MRASAVIVVLLLATAGPAAAQQAGCQLQLVNTVPLTMSRNGLRALVPVTINGSPERLLLDTGGAITQLSRATIDRLQIPVSDSRIRMLDLYGNAASGAASIKSFVLGHLEVQNTEVAVSPFDIGGTPPVAGAMAADYMARYDPEFDFADAKLNYLSPQHCPGKVIYWPASAVAVVPMKFVNSHLQIDVELNGKHVRAILDTGASGTVLMATEAKRLFDLTETSPDITDLRGADGEKTFEKVFDTLTFDGIAIGHPHITVIPDQVGKHDVNNGYVTGTRVKRVDDRAPDEPAMLIGMNILTKLRFVVAFSENKIYLTPATPPQPTPASSH